MFVCECKCARVCLYVCARMCVNVCVHVCVHARILILTQTQNLVLGWEALSGNC